MIKSTLFAGSLAAAALGLLPMATASATGGTAPHVSGNFEYMLPQYFCEKGIPAVAGYFRTGKTPEKSVTLTAGKVSKSLGGGKAWTPGVYAAASTKGAAGRITVTGSTSGTGFTVTIDLPKTCAGLPTTQPRPPHWVTGPVVETDGAAPAGDTTSLFAGAGLLAAGGLTAAAGLRARAKNRR